MQNWNHQLGLGKDFLAVTPKVQSIKLKTDTLDFIKIKTPDIQEAFLRNEKCKP